jgi:large subunit ribosomal protein L25
MTREKFELQSQPRPEGRAAKTRAGGMIPAIVYGHGIATQHLALPYPAFEKVFRKAGESTIITLVVEGKPKNVLIQDVQRHYLTGRYQHIDFYEVSMTEKLKATVPLVFIGISKAVKEQSGILVTVLNEVEVECLPADLPHNIEVDISVLDTFGKAIHVRDLNVDSKVTIMAPAEETVATVTPPRDVEAELAAPVVEDVSAVEGAAEDKPAAEGEAATEEKKDKK